MHDVESHGRLCLFGEHSDWAAEFQKHIGLALASPLKQGFHAKVEECELFEIFTIHGNFSISFDGKSLFSAAKNKFNFFSYCCGTAYYMKNKYDIQKGIHISLYYEDLPIQAGLSSSAAICILVAEAFNKVYTLGLNKKDIMEAAYNGEQLTGSKCGRLDQIGAFPPSLYLMTFQFDGNVLFQVAKTQGTWNFFYVVLGKKKDTKVILSNLKKAYAHNEKLREYLGVNNQKLTKQVLEEMKRGNYIQFGKLMNEVQELFDIYVAPLSPNELVAPRFHALMKDAVLQQYIYGGKEIGSHGDGSALFIAKSAEDADRAILYINRTYHYAAMNCPLK